MTTLSVVVPLGFINQYIHDEFGNDTGGGDEFYHMAPIMKVKDGIELVIIDRAWPTRWHRVEEELGELVARGAVIYAPPKPSPFVENGYRACCCMRNTGAICSSGDILAFVDDYVMLEGEFVQEIIEHYQRTGLVLCPVCLPKIDQNTPDGPPSDCGGHNSGIYMCSSEQFSELNGFDENLDGSYGEEDTEFQDRLDRLLWLRQKGYRQRRKGLVWPRVEHTNGDFVQSLVPFWDGQPTKGNLRCNKSYVKNVSYPRIRDSKIRGNIPPTKEMLDKMRASPCTDICPRCNASDREQQIESYADVLRMSPDISSEMSARVAKLRGKVNPWAME